jgi:hypothetical protein
MARFCAKKRAGGRQRPSPKTTVGRRLSSLAAPKERIIAYFPWVIAVCEQNLLLIGCCCSDGSWNPMSDLPHEQSRLTAVDSWALAIATAFVVLIVIGVLPRMSW